jgi:hypothetical protein
MNFQGSHYPVVNRRGGQDLIGNWIGSLSVHRREAPPIRAIRLGALTGEFLVFVETAFKEFTNRAHRGFSIVAVSGDFQSRPLFGA